MRSLGSFAMRDGNLTCVKASFEDFNPVPKAERHERNIQLSVKMNNLNKLTPNMVIPEAMLFMASGLTLCHGSRPVFWKV